MKPLTLSVDCQVGKLSFDCVISEEFFMFAKDCRLCHIIYVVGVKEQGILGAGGCIWKWNWSFYLPDNASAANHLSSRL